MTKAEFMKSKPIELPAYYKAYKMKQKMQDENAWVLGLYIQSAVSTAVEHVLAGKKAKSQYIKEPFLAHQQMEEMTQEEKDELELQKMLLAEKQWQTVGAIRNLPKTIMK